MATIVYSPLGVGIFPRSASSEAHWIGHITAIRSDAAAIHGATTWLFVAGRASLTPWVSLEFATRSGST